MNESFTNGPSQWPDSSEELKTCTSIPCPSWEDYSITVEEWIPTVDELRQAGCAIMQPDGSYYSLVDGEVVHFSEDGTVIAQ